MTGRANAPAPEGLRLDRVHLIGVGGAGMSGIARVLLARGAQVTGSDAKDSRTLAVLRALGAGITVGHVEDAVDGADVVVISTAIRDTNPELVEARRRGLTVIHRAAALATLMQGSRGIAVAGTHGKTTTTSMTTVMLQHCGADPSFAIGGDLNEPGSNAHQGSGDLFVAEADESDGSFLLLSPHVAVVTNVEADHLDHYGDLAAVELAFAAFVRRIDPDGFLVSCGDDAGARRLATVARDAGTTVRTYGEGDDVDVRVADLVLDPSGGLSFEVVADGRRLGRQGLRVPGRHNALDAAAALTVGLGLGFGAVELREGLAGYTGVRRRMEPKGTAGGVRVVDSYAHHPTEIRADLAAARQVANGGRVVVVFQPHLFSRTLAFAPDFGAALGAADEVVVMDVYAAREDDMPGVTGALVADRVPLPADRVHYEPRWDAAPALLAALARPGDVVLTVGAGDVTQVGPAVLALLDDRGA